MTDLEERCLLNAHHFIQLGLSNLELFELSDLLIKLEEDKKDKNKFTDNYIDYNDEIVSIEKIGIKETIDIGVSGDNLFYCNDILTKNSFGTAATVDNLVALIKTDELDQLNQVIFKQIKNRDNDVSRYKRFIVGVDKQKMKLYDIEQDAQVEALDETSDRSYSDDDTKTSKFSNFKY